MYEGTSISRATSRQSFRRLITSSARNGAWLKLFFASFLAESVRLRGNHRPGFHPFFGHPHSKRRDRLAIRYHYDVSNDFYELWLDRNMIYSCAHFRDFSDDLETAQSQRIELICSKLCLRPGERLLDIGCGWGGLIMHAVRNFGVEAIGVTISDAQASLAESRIRKAGLSTRCRVYRLDYRDVDETGVFDKVANHHSPPAAAVGGEYRTGARIGGRGTLSYMASLSRRIGILLSERLARFVSNPLFKGSEEEHFAFGA